MFVVHVCVFALRCSLLVVSWLMIGGVLLSVVSCFLVVGCYLLLAVSIVRCVLLVVCVAVFC